mmetsp:Transcript_6280/g.9127  ORF Transcript_6280/g.9127 Transcript_6280/m.9127 type:complete len:120 (+) Transcript_6280:21-380(+)
MAVVQTSKPTILKTRGQNRVYINVVTGLQRPPQSKPVYFEESKELYDCGETQDKLFSCFANHLSSEEPTEDEAKQVLKDCELEIESFKYSCGLRRSYNNLAIIPTADDALVSPFKAQYL